jgi:two-component system, cell cycle response regulator
MGDWDEHTTTETIVHATLKPAPRRAYLIVLAGGNVGDMHGVNGRLMIGRSPESHVRLLNDGVSRRHAVITVQGEEVRITDLDSHNGTFINDTRITEAVLRDGDKVRIGSNTVLKFTLHDELDDAFQRSLYEAALFDGLTKAINRRSFVERLNAEVAFAARHGTMLSLIMFDLDVFKRINDTYGHPAGDLVLVRISDAVREAVRCEDVFARLGGDEFAVLCRGIDLAGAKVLAERLRARLAMIEHVCGKEMLQVTASFGVAALQAKDEAKPASFRDAADRVLYEAKRAGGNRVVGWE